MITPDRRRLIEELSMRLLKRAGTLGILPTPVDRLSQLADLVVDREVDLLADAPMPSTATRWRTAWAEKVRWLSLKTPAVIQLNLAGLPAGRGLTELCSVAHRLLPLFVIDGCEQASEPTGSVGEARDEEAAYFAVLTLFQHARFDREMARLELSLKAGLVLSQTFGGPVPATLSRMVERSRKRCALLVMEGIPSVLSAARQAVCWRKDLFFSKRFTTDFGRLGIPHELTADWLFARDFLAGCPFREDGQVVLNTANGFALFHYHFLGWKGLGFVFIMPEDEWQFSSIQIELMGI